MEQKKNSTDLENLNTINVKKGKFDLVFDVNKISDKERFDLETKELPKVEKDDKASTDTNEVSEVKPIQTDISSTEDNVDTKKDIKKIEKTPEQKAKSVKNVMQFINVSLYTGVFVCIVGGMIFLQRPTVSESENRNLAKFPSFSVNSLMDGSYTADITNWFDDTVPFRDVFKDISAKFRSVLGLDYDGIVVVNVNGNGVGNKDNSSYNITNDSYI